MSKTLWAIALLVLGLSISSSAQCIDTNYFVPPLPICLSLFEPVCGCDGVTYKNYDCAWQEAGVLSYQFGPCGTLASNHYPNPVVGSELLYIQVLNKYEDDINIEIKNLSGTLYKFEHYSRQTFLTDEYNLSGYPRGLYFMFIYNSTEFQVRKFMVWEP